MATPAPVIPAPARVSVRLQDGLGYNYTADRITDLNSAFTEFQSEYFVLAAVHAYCYDQIGKMPKQ
jgi:hypothetical protein